MTDVLINRTRAELYFDWQILAQMLKKKKKKQIYLAISPYEIKVVIYQKL